MALERCLIMLAGWTSELAIPVAEPRLGIGRTGMSEVSPPREEV